MLHAIKNYLLHLVKSIHLHGIHSPFIFTLQHHCFYAATPASQLATLKAYRDKLGHDTTELTVADHGAGSKHFKSNSRTVAAILKINSTPLKRAALLARICNYLNVNRALELGTSLGVGTQALALNGAEVTSIEASQNIYDYTASKLKDYKNISLVHGTFHSYLKGELTQKPHGTYDLIFIDGHHDGAATVGYFNELLPYAHGQTVFILDDIYWSPDMTKAWKSLQKHDSVTASIDCFHLGFLFLRKEQNQQAFHIKL